MTLSAGQNKAAVFDIQRFSVHDGPGIRSTVFFKGCPLKCRWCHNPESWNINTELIYAKDKCISCGRCLKVCKNRATGDRLKCAVCGACAAVCPPKARRMTGAKIEMKALMQEILKDRDFYKFSGGGVTASGGEPLLQAKFVAAFFKLCKKAKLKTVLQTCGYGKKQDLEGILRYTDLVLLDIKHMNSKEHKKATGVGNEQILENAKLIAKKKLPLLVRVPLVPGFNDSKEQIKAIVKFASSLKTLEKIHLLQFHTLGMHKWELLGKVAPEYPAVLERGDQVRQNLK